MKHLPKQILFFFVAIFSVLAFNPINAFAQKAKPDDVVGTWLTGEGTAKVQIYKENGKYFGKIVWLREPNNEQGKPKVDSNNPENKLKTQPILGLVNLKDFKYAGENVWEDGTIYDPKKGKTYSSIMTLTDPNTLDVRGYIGISLIGRSDTWKRQK